MSTSTLPMRVQVQSEPEPAEVVWMDWGAAASPAVRPSPRIEPPAYVYRGSAASHWSGQGCDLIDSEDTRTGMCKVVFSCGCIGEVPLSSLERAFSDG